MAIHLLMSACLVGHCCRRDAQNGKSCVNSALHKPLDSGQVAVICPEMAGGLDVPRPAAEIAPDSTAAGILKGEGRVVNTDGEDVTQAFVKGAHAALGLVNKHNIKVAILKSMSPSCGVHAVCDGSFTHKETPGSGVTAELLRAAGIAVFDETELDAALAALEATV